MAIHPIRSTEKNRNKTQTTLSTENGLKTTELHALKLKSSGTWKVEIFQLDQ